MNVKTKIRLGLIFLLAIIIMLAAAGSYYVNKLADESKDMLKDNYNTLQYTKNMVQALDDKNEATGQKSFEENLVKQENNITELGEADATREMRSIFELYKAGHKDAETQRILRDKILVVQKLNMDAIAAKNNRITQSTKTAFAYVTILGTLCFLLSFTFVINFPRWITGPIAQLTQGIRSIANKDYTTRIRIETKDEFGELAAAFNNMAAELDAWEHSNVAQLIFEKSRIETIINSMQDAIIGLDDKKNVLFINEVAENLLTLKKTDVIGKYAADIALKNDLFRNLLNQDADRDLKIYANNKESFFTKNYAEVKNGDTVIGEVIALHNVTPFKELDSAKTNFIATVSHELKTPLSSMQMSLKLLEDERIGKLNEEQQKLMANIKGDRDRLLKITGELLNITQAETGNIQLNVSPVTARHIVDLAIEAVQSVAGQRSIQLQAQLADNLPYVNADLDKTVWVLVNLLSNAIRYAPEQSTVRLVVKEHSKLLEFAVTDDGIGIDEKYLPRVFERYFKVPGSAGGTGLGLAICKEFIEAQGGRIWASSEVSKGSTFSFELNKARA